MNRKNGKARADDTGFSPKEKIKAGGSNLFVFNFKLKPFKKQHCADLCSFCQDLLTDDSFRFDYITACSRCYCLAHRLINGLRKFELNYLNPEVAK